MTPSAAQAKAIRAIVDWYRGGDSTPQEFYLAGFAGTGKTTIYKEVRAALLAAGARSILTAAFTGKAAMVLRRKGIEDASTLHSLLYAVSEDPDTGKPIFALNKVGPMLDADLLGMDEVSMVNRQLADDARSFGKKLLVMGDPGQLPPVSGQGAFTNREPDFFLHEIHRQAAESPIIRIATAAREGRPIQYGEYGSGVVVLPIDRETYTCAFDPETQTICGTNRTRRTVTQRIRALRGYEGEVPFAGERVICLRNDRDNGIFNGQLGTMLQDAGPHPQDILNLSVDVAMDDAPLPLKRLPVLRSVFAEHFGADKEQRPPRGYQQFDWGNVLTVHKMQGSEAPHITIIDEAGAFGIDANKWRYTGFTRAMDGLTVLTRHAVHAAAPMRLAA